MNGALFQTILLFSIIILSVSCGPATKSDERNNLSVDSEIVSYDIQIRQPKFKPKSTASLTMYYSDKVDRILIEDFENVKENRYKLVEKPQMVAGPSVFYEAEFIYRNIDYFEDSNEKVSKTIRVPYDIRWNLKEVPEKFKPRETMVVDVNGEYTYENMPRRFKNNKTGKERVVITRVTEPGKIEEETRYMQDVIKDFNIKYENQRITIQRKKGFDISGFLNETGLNKYDLMVRENKM